jgi:hypothetical protein
MSWVAESSLRARGSTSTASSSEARRLDDRLEQVVRRARAVASHRRRRSHGIIEIGLGSGHRVRVDDDVDGTSPNAIIEIVTPARIRQSGGFRRVRTYQVLQLGGVSKEDRPQGRGLLRQPLTERTHPKIVRLTVSPIGYVGPV